MSLATMEVKWDEFRRNMLHWWNKRRNDRFIKVDNAPERSISILQKRYGYTREQASYQLDKHYPLRSRFDFSTSQT